MHTHTHTHDTNYPTLLLRDIQLINTECTPCKHRTDAVSTQSRCSGYAGLIKSGHRTETLGASSRPEQCEIHYFNISSGCRFVRLSRFVAAIYGIRELLWFPFKLANFPKFCDIYCWKGKYFKSFPWICDLAAVDNVTVDGRIVTGRNCRFV